MKCLRKTLLVCLLILVALSPAYCGGWGAFRGSSKDSSNGSSEMMTQEKPSVEEQSKESSTEATSATVPTDSVLEGLETTSKTYDAVLEETQDVLKAAEEEVAVAVATERPKKAEEKKSAIEEAKAIVQELVASKAALDEDHAILADTIVHQQKTITAQHRKLEGINFGIGASVGYRYLAHVSPGVTLQMRVQHWTVRMDFIMDMDYSQGFVKAFDIQPDDFEVRLGFVYEF